MALRRNITLSLLIQGFGTVLSSVGWRLQDDAFPVLLLFSASVCAETRQALQRDSEGGATQVEESSALTAASGLIVQTLPASQDNGQGVQSL